MPKRLINLQPHFLTQPQEVPSMAPSPKSLTCTDGSPTAWKVIVLANLVFTTTSVAQYQKVSCGILGYLANLEPSFSQLILKMCRACAGQLTRSALTDQVLLAVNKAKAQDHSEAREKDSNTAFRLMESTRRRTWTTQKYQQPSV